MKKVTVPMSSTAASKRLGTDTPGDTRMSAKISAAHTRYTTITAK